MKKIKNRSISQKRIFKTGSYILLISVLAVAAAVFINLLVSALPENILHIDTTSNHIYDFSKETLSLLNSLEEDIDIYCVAQSGNEDPTVVTFLSRYADRSAHISVTYIDPVLYPNFVSSYTNASLSEGSLIVESQRRMTIVDYSEMYDYRMNYSTYIYDTFFTGESAVTSAVDFVTSENLPKVYTLSGHGEISFDSNLSSAIERQNIALVPLSLLSRSTVPDDCQCLIICSPASDLSKEESAAILDYLKSGGNMLIFADYSEENMPNFSDILSYYGVALGKGIVIEGDSAYHIAQYPHYLLPDIKEHDITAPLIDGYYILEPVSEPIIYPDEPIRTSVKYWPILQTSTSSFMKKPDGYQLSDYEYKDGDEKGPFTTALALTEDICPDIQYDEDEVEHKHADDSDETRLIVFSSSYIADASISNYVAGANEDLILNSLDWMTQREDSISISAKQVSMDYLSMSEKDSSIGAVLMLALPVILLCAGIAILIKRKRRK